MSRVSALLLVVVCALVIQVALMAQAPSTVSLTVQPPSTVDVLFYPTPTTGTVLVQTDQAGKATLDLLKIANAGKIGKLTATEERCGDTTRLLLTADNGQLPPAQPGCRRRRAGAFVVGKDTAFTAKMGGLSTTTKAALIGGGAAAAAVVVATRGGDSTAAGGSSTPPPPSGGGVDLTALYGTFNITATKVTDTGCNFQATFTGQVQLSGHTDGTALAARMIERLTRIYAGSMQSSGSFSGTGSGNLDGFAYDGTITGQVGSNKNTIQGRETLNFTSGCPGKQVIYDYSGSR